MRKNPQTLHVNPVGENWEVESKEATLGQAETKPEAVELATELAAEAKAGKIQIHASDGRVEREIPLARQFDGPTPSPAWLPAKQRPGQPPPNSLFVIGVRGEGGEWNGCHLVLSETCEDGTMHEVSSGMPLGFTWVEIDWWLPLEIGAEMMGGECPAKEE